MILNARAISRGGGLYRKDGSQKGSPKIKYACCSWKSYSFSSTGACFRPGMSGIYVTTSASFIFRIYLAERNQHRPVLQRLQ